MSNGGNAVRIDNRAVLIYAPIATLMYLGIYLGKYVLTIIGVGLLLVITSYLLTWDLLMTMLLSTLRLDNEVVVSRSQVTLKMRAVSPLPLKVRAEATPICSPHLACGNYEVVINGALGMMRMDVRWFGVAKVLGLVLRVTDPMKVLTNSAFVKMNRDIALEPTEREVKALPGWRVGESSSRTALVRSRMGDFVGLREYDFVEPASSIHWVTSARVGELMSIDRSEVGNLPRLVVMEYTPRMLKPIKDHRPIDTALMYLRHMIKGDAVVVLIGNGMERPLYHTRHVLLSNLELKLRILVMGMENKDEIIGRAREVLGKYVSEFAIDDLMAWLYPTKLDKGLTREDIKALGKYLRRNPLLIITRESLNELQRSGVDLRGASIIVADGEVS